MGLVGSDTLHTPSYKPTGSEVAVFTTSRGEVRARLDAEGAPIHVANFCELASAGFYDGLKFHRYVPGFVIQGGCPTTRTMSCEDVAAGLSGPDGMPGTGGPGYSIRGEFSTNPHNSHDDGALAMARSQNPDSAGSQFYFCLGPQHMLDSGYTVSSDRPSLASTSSPSFARATSSSPCASSRPSTQERPHWRF